MILPPIIGFTGPAGAGKDTVAAALRQLLLDSDQHATVLAFAAPIRRMLAALPIPPEYMADRALKEAPIPILGVSYRELAQRLGTEWGRDLHSDFWVRLMAREVAHLPSGSIAVITDVRFENEADWIHDNGGVLVRIERPGVQPVREHISEAEARGLDVDFRFLNDQPLAALPAVVADLVASIRHTQRVELEA